MLLYRLFLALVNIEYFNYLLSYSSYSGLDADVEERASTALLLGADSGEQALATSVIE